MNDELQKANDTLKRAGQQLDIIEQLITLLMADMDLSELATSARLTFTLKLMAEHARTLKLYDTFGKHELAGSEQALIGKLLRQLHSDPPDEDPGDFLEGEEGV